MQLKNKLQQRIVVCVFAVFTPAIPSKLKDQTCTKVSPPPNLISATSTKIVALTCHKGCSTKCNLINLTSSLENQSIKQVY
jgi:hypothetical protein